jgi:RHS repeat-associated protein
MIGWEVRHRPSWVQWTAVLGVGLTLMAGMRPAFAGMTTAAPPASAGPGPMPGSPAPPSRPPQGSGAGPSVNAAFDGDVRARVRTRVSPAGLKILASSGASVLSNDDPWALFDGDADSHFGAAAMEPVRVRVALAEPTSIAGFGVYGQADGSVAMLVEGGGGTPKSIAGLDHSVAGLPLRWNRFDAVSPVTASALVLEWRPTHPGASLREIEIWGLMAPTVDSSSDQLPDQLLVGVPRDATEAIAEPEAQTVAAPDLGLGGSATFHVQLDRDARAFGRAFLIYELEGLPHWSAAVRQINGNSVQGGAGALRGSRGGLQVEEIAPAWLQSGPNQIRFAPADNSDPIGYHVRHVRIVGVPAGEAPTTIDARSLGHGGTPIDVPLPAPSQLDSLAVRITRTVTGTLSIEPTVRGKLQPRGRASIALDGLQPGWATFSLGGPTGALPADGLRVALRGTAEGKGSIAEIRVVTSPVPAVSPARLAVTYPLHGECVSGQAYLRGFVTSQSDGTRNATLTVDGAPVVEGYARDGAFGIVVEPHARGRRAPWSVTLAAKFPNGQEISRKVAIDACTPAPVPTPPGTPIVDEGAPFGQVVRAGEAASISFGGAKLQIPAGAVTEDVRITVRPLTASQVPALDDTMTNVTPERRGYRLGPHGLRFAKPVTLILPYDRQLMPAAGSDDEIGTMYFDEGSGAWQKVRSLADATGTVEAGTEHFTDFINARIAVPDHPTAAAFDANTMKGVKMADPFARIRRIEPPRASPDGAVHLSYPIDLPPGRAGMQPNVEFTYNSDAVSQNSWVGVGWNLEVPYIEVDTRFGVPRYAPDIETETYLLDGEQLSPTADRVTPAARSTTDKVFYRRVEGRFDRIIRTGTSPNDYAWKVTDKNGTVYTYGSTLASRVTIAEGTPIFRWYLASIEDLFGNLVQYTYVRDSGQLGGEAWTQLYPRSIDYTAHVSNSGFVDLQSSYHVNFALTPLDFQGGAPDRPDTFSTGRPGFLVRTRQKLGRIDVKFQGEDTLSYLPAYITGDFGKTLLQKIIVGVPEQDPEQGLAGLQSPTFYEHDFAYMHGDPSFGAPQSWGALLRNGGLSLSDDGSLYASHFAGFGAICDEHGGIGGSSTISFGSDAAWFLADGNFDRISSMFMDFNGDGVPDSVGGGQTQLGLAGGGFLPGPVGPTGFLSKSDRTRRSLQTGTHLLSEHSHITLERSWAHTEETQTVADMDGDGRPDLVSLVNGSVEVALNTGSSFTDPQPWNGFGLATVDFTNPDEQANLATLLYADPISRWTAPWDGTVRVGGTAQKIADFGTQDDGVTLSIFYSQPNHNNDGLSTSERRLWTKNFLHDDLAPCVPGAGGNGAQAEPDGSCTGPFTIQVSKGDVLTFLLDSINTTAGDDVMWSPNISYLNYFDTTVGGTVSVTPERHQDHEPWGPAIFDFDQSADFPRMASAPGNHWTASSNGTVMIESNGLIKDPSADDILIQVVKNRGRTGFSEEILYAGPSGQAGPFPADFSGPIVFSFSADVQKDDTLTFSVSSDTPLNPSNIHAFFSDWAPTVSYIRLCRTVPNTVELTHVMSDTGQQVCGKVNCQSRASDGKTVCPIDGDPIPDAPESTATIFQSVPPAIATPTFDAPIPTKVSMIATGDPLTFSPPRITGQDLTIAVIQGPNKLYWKGVFNHPGLPAIINPPSILTPPAGAPITFSLYTTSEQWDPIVSQVNQADIRVQANIRGPLAVAPSLSTQTVQTTPPFLTGTQLLQGGFHGWTFAEWNIAHGPGATANFQNFMLAESTTPKTWQQLALNFANSAINRPFPFWGEGDLYLAAGQMKPSRQGLIGASADLVPGAFRNSTSTTTTFGEDLAQSNSLSGTDSLGKVEFMDINGDRFTDSIAGNTILLNNGTNGFESKSNEMSFAPSHDGGQSDADPRVVRSTQISGGIGVGAPIPGLNADGTSEAIGSISLFTGVGYGFTTTKVDMVDVNGDGLPDHVLLLPGSPPQMFVRLNLGNRFSAEIPWSVPAWQIPSLGKLLSPGDASFPNDIADLTVSMEANAVLASDTAAVKLEDNASNTIDGSVGSSGASIGVGSMLSANRTYVDFVDINGDGLPDRVMKLPGDSVIRYQLNTGEQFISGGSSDLTFGIGGDWGVTLEDSLAQGLGKNDALAFTETDSHPGTTGFAYGFQTFFGCFVPETIVGGEVGHSQSQLRFEDVDGDGTPDRVLKLNSDNAVRVELNRSGQANLLIEVTLPGGGEIFPSYKRQGNIVRLSANPDPVTGRNEIVDMPTNQYVMASVLVADGQGGPGLGHVLQSTFDYFNSGFYDRPERENLGYQHIQTTHPDGSHTDAYFRNQEYTFRHLPDVVLESDTSGNLWSKVSYTYDLRSVAGATAVTASGDAEAQFPAEVDKTTSYYEFQTADPAGRQIKTEETRDYDTLGNLISFGDLGDLASGTTAVFYKIGYDPSLSGNYAFKANLVEARDAPGGTGNLLRQRTATYDSRGGFLTIANRLVGGRDPANPTLVHDGTQNPSTALLFDAFGNLSSFTDPSGYSISYSYDPITQSFRTASTDTFGLTSTAVPKYEWGTLAQVTDANGEVEKFGFDGFGRPSFVRGPKDIDGQGNDVGIPTIQFTYNLSTQLASAITQHKDVSSVGSGSTATIDTYTYVDGFERVIQTKKMNEVSDASGHGIPGFTISGALTFEVMGHVLQQGQPAFVATTGTEAENVAMLNPTTFTYDQMSRVKTVERPDGAMTSTTYTVATSPSLPGRNLLEKTVTDPMMNTRIEWRDGRQRVLFVDEENIIPPATTSKTLTTQYQYDHMDQLLAVMDAKNNTTSAAYDTLGQMVTLASPDAGRTEYLYGVNGLLGAKETANLRASNKLIKYQYDHGRLTVIDHPDSLDVTYVYGAPTAANGQRGRIASITDESGVETRNYDELGNMSHMERTPAPQVASGPKFTYKMDYVYDSFGRVLNMTYPDGEVVTYHYNVGGLPKTVSGTIGTTTTNYVNGILYTELEQRAQMTLGDGSFTKYTYDPLMRRLQTLNTTAGGITLQQDAYFYDEVGNVQTLQNMVSIPTTVATGAILPGQTMLTFGYDNLYQLTSATGKYQGCASGCGSTRKNTLTLTYDEIGNIQHKTQTDVVVSATGTSTTQEATSYDAVYKYAGAGPHAATGFGMQALTYDADGNQITSTGTFGVARTLAWNEEDRLKSETDRGFTNTFLYDADGNRTHKRRTTLETVYVNPYYVIKNWLTQTKHVMVGDTRVATTMAMLTTAGKPSTAGAPVFFYYHPDHLQSTAFVTNQTGKLLQHDEYFASGEVWFQEALNQDSRNTQPYLFNAKELDETGFYYYGARHLDPRMSMWINPDPILDGYMRGDVNGGVFQPRNLGLYTYTWNNPVVLRDPNGQAGEAQIIEVLTWIEEGPIGPTVLRVGGGLLGAALGWLASHESAGGYINREDAQGRALGNFFGGNKSPNTLMNENKGDGGQADKTKTAPSGPEAPARRAENVKKGMPESRLGPSGRPKIHTIDHSNRKSAKDAASQEGKGAPIEHPNDQGQPPHFHPTEEGEKSMGGTHHKFPARSSYPKPEK